ncbi:hypothetical protein [Pseudomonas putida]|uniref:hypothetical protein n=1 Tax=Pseudomonas putida TaxID=303 RepID=UPI0039E133F0
MSSHRFQLTYSITHLSDTEKSLTAAKQVRDKIARTQFENWTKVEKVETTFKGTFYLRKLYLDDRKTEAEDIVRMAFGNIMSELNASLEVWAHCSLMVEGLGESLEFSF